MSAETFWPKPLQVRGGTKKFLRGRPFYHDFDWCTVFPSSKPTWSRFPGLKTVGEVVAAHVPDGDWSNVFIILTTETREALVHQERDGLHYFVFDAIQLRDWKPSATTAFLGRAASTRPEMLDAYQLVKESPENLKRLMLATDPSSVLVEIRTDEARQLLPMALGVVTQALRGEQIATDGGSPSSLNAEDFDSLVRALQQILAAARGRGDISSVLAVLDDLTNEQREYFRRHPEVVKLVAEEDIDAIEVTSWAYRKQQVQLYERMLREPSEIERYKSEHGITKPGEEPAWQRYFEQNRWIFGFALNFYFNEAVDARLETFSKGGTFLEEGKRPDALMATRALIRSLCFVEIKTPRKRLMGSKYRDDVWGPSEDLAGAVAQSQKAVYRSVRALDERFRLEDAEGTEHGAPIYTVYPRSFVVIGMISEFFDADGNEKKKLITSFELYRRDLLRPEVITFDELLERARHLASPSTRGGSHKSEADGELNR